MFNNLKVSLSIYLFAVCFSINAQHDFNCYHNDPAAQERNHSVDITHMKVEVSFDVKAGKVMGTVNHSLVTIQKNIDTLFFDGPDVNIKSAQIDGKTAQFHKIPAGVVLEIANKWGFDEKHTVTFEYEATPKRGLYFIGWNNAMPAKPEVWHTRQQIWTQGQGIDNRNWIPMYDDMGDKFTTETIITFDENYQVLSNGKLLEKKADKKGNLVWHYKMEKPHAGYLLMLAIGKYAVKSTKTKRGTPVNFWYYPEFADRMEPTSRYTEKMIEFLEDETGTPYPWGSYSQIMVQDFLYGAMENTSATIFGDFFFVDERAYLDRNYVGVNCHELTHQWFGDLITARGPGDAWLQESFATYYAKIFDETILGADEVKFNFRRESESALAASKKDLLPIRHTASGTARIYPKGSAVLSMLRYVVGDEEFKRTIQHYLAKHGFQNVNTDDFQQAFKDKLGVNVDWFFNQWVWKGNEPHYQVGFDQFGNRAQFSISQIQQGTQADGLFRMPINFSIYYTDGTEEEKQVWIENQSTLVNFNTNGKNILYVLFDENNEILKQVTFDKPESMLIAQAEKAKFAIDRFDAIKGLEKYNIDKKIALYTKLYKNESFYAVRQEMVRQLTPETTAKNFTLAAIKDEHARVRETVASLADSKIYAEALIGLLKDQSYKVVETAFDNLVNHHVIFSAAQLAAVDGINNSIAAKYNAYQYALEGDEKYTKKLIRLSSPDYEFRTRINAFEALKKLNYMDENLANNLIQATKSYNSRLANPAQTVIDYYKQQGGMTHYFEKK